MLSIVLPVLVVFSTVLMSTANVQSILDTVRAKQAERWASVDNYTVTLSVQDAGGLETPVYYEKMEVDGQPTFRMVPPAEYAGELHEKAGFPPLSPEALEEYASGLDMLGDAMAGGGGDMPAMDLRAMTGQMSAFARAGASYDEDDGSGDAADAVNDMAEFAQRAELAGTERVSVSSTDPDQTREAYLVVAKDLSDVDLDQPEGDATFTLETISLWVDAEHYVPLRLLMKGEVESKDKKTPLTIEKLDLDYQQVGPLYESHQQIYKLSGLMAGMSEKERKDMEKAKKELEKSKKELENMPKEQRDMVMKMMGSQMEKLEKMVEGDAITSITDVVSIAVNEGPPTPYGLGDLTVGGPAAATYPGALTYTGQFEDGRAQLSVVARLPGSSEAFIGLVGDGPFPQSGQVSITDADGTVEIEGGASVTIEGGSGSITVTVRSATRIAGTFTAMLSGTLADDNSTSVQFSASGTFGSGAPVGPFQAPRGSPFPAELFSGQ